MTKCLFLPALKVGEGIRCALQAGVCRREDLFVTSKLWNTYHAAQHVEPACRRSLEDLGLDYLDLYLVHFPISLQYVPFSTLYPPRWNSMTKARAERLSSPPRWEGTAVGEGLRFSSVPVSETWAGMEGLVGAGLVRDIGLSNWGSQGLRDLLSYCSIPPAVLQVTLEYQSNKPIFWPGGGAPIPAVQWVTRPSQPAGGPCDGLLSPGTVSL